MMIDKSHIAQDQIPKPKPVYRVPAGRQTISAAQHKPVEMDDIMKALMKQPAFQEVPELKPDYSGWFDPIEHRSAPPLGASGHPEKDIRGVELKPTPPGEETLTDARPILTQAEIKSLTGATEKPTRKKNRTRRRSPQVIYQLPAKGTWRSAFCDVTIIAGCAVLLLLAVDIGIIGLAGYKFSLGVLQKAEQWK